MERLWSPWRLAYVTGSDGGGGGGCIFCQATAAPDQSEHVLVRGALAYVILNRYPYNNGHLLVVTNRHIATLAAATAAELDAVMRLTRHAEIALTEAYHPQGLNVGVNLGRPAGAGIVDHLHVHVVPRWNGDTNFMTVFGDVRVLPEALEQTAGRLRPLFEGLSREEDR